MVRLLNLLLYGNHFLHIYLVLLVIQEFAHG